LFPLSSSCKLLTVLERVLGVWIPSDSLANSVTGVIGEFDERLKKLNPTLAQIQYDIEDLLGWIRRLVRPAEEPLLSCQ
jgi:Enhancer of rudimentary